MTFLKPLPPTSAGREFELRTRVVGVYDKGKVGSVVETETVLQEKGGDVYTKSVGSAFMVGQGNWGGPKGESPSYILPINPQLISPQDRVPSTTHRRRTGNQTLHTFSKLRRNQRIYTGTSSSPSPSHPLIPYPQPKRRLQSPPRHARTRRQNGLRWRHHAWSFLMEQCVSWVAERAWGK